MIIELEINGARVIVSGDNLSVSVTEDRVPKRAIALADGDLPTAEQIGALRQHLDINQDDFGILFGVSQATVWRWENGSGEPRGAAAIKLAAMIKREFSQAEQPSGDAA